MDQSQHQHLVEASGTVSLYAEQLIYFKECMMHFKSTQDIYRHLT